MCIALIHHWRRVRLGDGAVLRRSAGMAVGLTAEQAGSMERLPGPVGTVALWDSC